MRVPRLVFPAVGYNLNGCRSNAKAHLQIPHFDGAVGGRGQNQMSVVRVLDVINERPVTAQLLQTLATFQPVNPAEKWAIFFTIERQPSNAHLIV